MWLAAENTVWFYGLHSTLASPWHHFPLVQSQTSGVYLAQQQEQVHAHVDVQVLER